jgi:hypothetical protein
VRADEAHRRERFHSPRVGLHTLCFRARDARTSMRSTRSYASSATIVHPRKRAPAPGYYSLLHRGSGRHSRLEINHVPGKCSPPTSPTARYI